MKNYYLLSNGRLQRKDNTLYVENAATRERKPVPVEDVDSLYLYGEVDLNTKLLNFLSQKRICLHVFNYYGYYSGSYYPREFLNSGFLLVQQVSHYTEPARRMTLARELVRASCHSLLRNVSYYTNRREGTEDEEQDTGREEQGAGRGARETEEARPGIPDDPELEAGVDAGLGARSLQEDPERGPEIDENLFGPLESSVLRPSSSVVSAPIPLTQLRQTIEKLALLTGNCDDVNVLRGVEGKTRERYYESWQHILAEGWVFTRRVRRPPDNEVNALISFGNGVLYTACLSEIYRTQLTPTISYLHEPGSRRYSLALDLSEIFKPLIVDRAIFRLLNTKQLQPQHFSREMEGCYLNDDGKRLFLAALEERFSATIRHRSLNRHVSYRHLIRLECYKLIRHLTGVEEYRAFRAWW